MKIKFITQTNNDMKLCPLTFVVKSQGHWVKVKGYIEHIEKQVLVSVLQMEWHNKTVLQR